MTDRRTVFTVALALALVVVGAVAASTFLAAVHVDQPALIGDLAKVALGALGSLLASTKSLPDAPAAGEQGGPPLHVQVNQQDAPPVPVDLADPPPPPEGDVAPATLTDAVTVAETTKARPRRR